MGANLGSGLLVGSRQPSTPQLTVRQVPVGNLLFKVLVAFWAIAPFMGLWLKYTSTVDYQCTATQVVVFHLAFNVLVAIAFIGFTGIIARRVEKLLPPTKDNGIICVPAI